MPRPRVGPLIDFRVPDEAKQRAEALAALQGRFVDEVCREIFLAGLEALTARIVRPASRRAAFVPGGGFLVEDENAMAAEEFVSPRRPSGR